jgi:hypothetical protein
LSYLSYFFVLSFLFEILFTHIVLAKTNLMNSKIAQRLFVPPALSFPLRSLSRHLSNQYQNPLNLRWISHTAGAAKGMPN